jgi:GT2 family glycosyltransferase
MLDICVLTAGRFDLLTKCLDAIQMASEFTPCNVYVLDNGSKNRLTEGKDVFNHPVITKHKRLNRNVGYGGGANAVIHMGRSPLVLFVSDDIILRPDVIKVLLETMKDLTIGLCGLKLLFPQDGKNGPPGKVQHVGHSVNLKAEIVHPFIGWSADNPKCCQSGERYSVTGAVFMVRRRLFEAIGGFDPAYGTGYYEDVEMALQIKQRKGKIYCECSAVAEHYVGATYEITQDANLAHSREVFVSRNRKNLAWTDWKLR